MTHSEAVRVLTETIGLKQAPLAVYYADERPDDALVPKGMGREEHSCHIAWLKAVHEGRVMALDAENYGCGGAGFYLGFVDLRMEGFEYFLSTGIPGKLRGERYKKTPELAAGLDRTRIPAPAEYCIYQRLADVPDTVTPEAIIFAEAADQLSGLFTLANYGRPGRDNVVCPFASGCGALVHEVRRHVLAGEPRAILGQFDVSSRRCLGPDQLTFAAPWEMVAQMAEEAPESFLALEEWQKVRARTT